MRIWLGGNALIAAGLAWAVTDRVLLARYPLSWGGANIGGGMILLVAYGCILGGVLLLLVGGWSAFGVRVRELRPPAVAVPLVVNALLVLGYVAVTVAMPARDVNVGTVAVTVSDGGSPVLVLQLCRGSVDRVTIVGPNRGAQPNEQFAELTAPAPITAPVRLDVKNPPDGWRGGPASLPYEREKSLLHIANAWGDQSKLRQVSFTAEELSALDPATVQVTVYDRNSEEALVPLRMPAAELEAWACDADG
jgi:hypothetical protein